MDPLAPNTHYEWVTSHTPPTVDGFAIGEGKWLVCEMCGASLLITPADGPPHISIDDMEHDPLPISGDPCPQGDDVVAGEAQPADD